MKKFLQLCVQENRYNDAVVFLRAIKNMTHGWDSRLYVQLRDSTVDEIYVSSGNKLDLIWLGLGL